MHLGVVTTFDVCNIENSILIYVDQLECLNAYLCPELIQWSDNHTNELIEINFTISTVIETFEKSHLIFLVDIDSEVTNGLVEFIWIECARAIVIHDFELTGKTDQAA